ncbi:MAG TPA: hypothetical protein VJ693_14140 [Ideonella sp.]|nr:hypothetical protein [Ideonella sp.]
MPLGLLAGMACAAGSGWPELPDPPRSKVEWVGRDVRVNGLPSRIEHFESELSPDEVLDHYRSRWSRSANSLVPRETSAAGWRSIAMLQDRYQMVVQVRSRSPQGSEGMLSVADFGDFKADYLPRNWPTWPNTRVTQVTESLDGPKHSWLVSMVSDDGFELNLRRFRDEWARRGFALTQEHASQPAPGVRAWVGVFDRADEAIDMTIAWRESDRRTFISANLVSTTQGAAR